MATIFTRHILTDRGLISTRPINVRSRVEDVIDEWGEEFAKTTAATIKATAQPGLIAREGYSFGQGFRTPTGFWPLGVTRNVRSANRFTAIWKKGDNLLQVLNPARYAGEVEHGSSTRGRPAGNHLRRLWDQRLEGAARRSLLQALRKRFR